VINSPAKQKTTQIRPSMIVCLFTALCWLCNQSLSGVVRSFISLFITVYYSRPQIS